MKKITLAKNEKPITPDELCELAQRVPNDLGYVLHSDLSYGYVRAAHELARLSQAIQDAPCGEDCARWCMSSWGKAYVDRYPCTCWKAAAMKENA